jgi:hypothetical protein
VSFRPEKILAVLERHDVRYVVVGGLAATLHGAPTVTFDVDVVPDRSSHNLQRLSSALSELDARVRVEGIPDGLVFQHDPASLAAVQVLNLVTRFGDLDLTFSPAGIPSFEQWDEHAEDGEALGVHFRLASLEDVIRSKEAANRPKDHLTLPILRALLDRQRR